MTNVMDRDKVERLILQPMVDRGWEPPAKAKIEVIRGDYIDALARFPEPVLQRAFGVILASHKYRSWPSVAEFVTACGRFTADKDHGERPATKEIAHLRLARQAHDYAERRLVADNAKLMMRALRGAWDLEIKPWLYQRAMANLERGEEIYISEAELESVIAGWVAIGEARKASAAAVQKGHGHIGRAMEGVGEAQT